jgi:signal transduction histidine kinase
VDVDAGCPEDAAATAYFVVSEALTNAARHSGATRVRVDARLARSALRLEVADDGRGGAVPGGGLRGLDDRVRSLGGRLTLDSPSGSGTRITMELPCP